jgi:hypothetical protein
LAAFAISTVGAASAANTMGPNTAVAPAIALPTCINDARGYAALQGYLRLKQQSQPVQSIVQIFPQSEATDYYMDGLERRLSGRPAVTGAEQPRNPDVMSRTVRLMQSLTSLLSLSKYAFVAASGSFNCSGFLPGQYVLLGTVTASAVAGTSYWRADVAIPAPNRRRIYVVPTFRLLGQFGTR